MEDKIMEDKIMEDKIMEDKIMEDKIMEDKIMEDKIMEDKIIGRFWAPSWSKPAGTRSEFYTLTYIIAQYSHGERLNLHLSM